METSNPQMELPNSRIIQLFMEKPMSLCMKVLDEAVTFENLKTPSYYLHLVELITKEKFSLEESASPMKNFGVIIKILRRYYLNTLNLLIVNLPDFVSITNSNVTADTLVELNYFLKLLFYAAHTTKLKSDIIEKFNSACLDEKFRSAMEEFKRKTAFFSVDEVRQNSRLQAVFDSRDRYYDKVMAECDVNHTEGLVFDIGKSTTVNLDGELQLTPYGAQVTPRKSDRIRKSVDRLGYSERFSNRSSPKRRSAKKLFQADSQDTEEIYCPRLSPNKHTAPQILCIDDSANKKDSSFIDGSPASEETRTRRQEGRLLSHGSLMGNGHNSAISGSGTVANENIVGAKNDNETLIQMFRTPNVPYSDDSTSEDELSEVDGRTTKGGKRIRRRKQRLVKTPSTNAINVGAEKSNNNDLSKNGNTPVTVSVTTATKTVNPDADEPLFDQSKQNSTETKENNDKNVDDGQPDLHLQPSSLATLAEMNESLKQLNSSYEEVLNELKSMRANNNEKLDRIESHLVSRN